MRTKLALGKRAVFLVRLKCWGWGSFRSFQCLTFSRAPGKKDVPFFPVGRPRPEPPPKPSPCGLPFLYWREWIGIPRKRKNIAWRRVGWTGQKKEKRMRKRRWVSLLCFLIGGSLKKPCKILIARKAKDNLKLASAREHPKTQHTRKRRKLTVPKICVFGCVAFSGALKNKP